MNRLISETIKGLNSFRGIGYIRLNGFLIPLCGSIQLDGGNGCQVEWISPMVRRMRIIEPPIKAVISGNFDCNTLEFKSFDNLYSLNSGFIDGIPLGISNNINGVMIQMHAPFRFRYPNEIRRLVLNVLDNTLIFGVDPLAPAINWTNNGFSVFETEIWIP